MQVEKLRVGHLTANCYILTKDDKTIIIDPGAEAEKIIAHCEGKNVVGVLATHYHFDHVDALKEIEDYFNIKVSFKVDGFTMEAIRTPGHTEDSITYYFPDDHMMFTGDFLFKGTIGRTDLPTGSIDDMKRSLELMKSYPKETIVYPGHGYETTLADEIPKFSNYFN